MRSLYHYPLDPASRQARIALEEKKLKVKLIPVDPWEPDEKFLELTPEAMPPTLVDTLPGQSVVITGSRAICEYAHENSSRYPLLSDNPVERAEARRLAAWFDNKFTNEVNAYILHEKVEKSLTGQVPHPPTLRQGREHLEFHLDYLAWLLERRDWLAGLQYSLADIAAAAHLSCLDFLGEVKWRDRPRVKEWYQTLKSRPSMRPILADRMPGLRRPQHYADLDF